MSQLCFCLFSMMKTPERPRPTPPRESLIRTRAPSPRREGRYLLTPRIHRSSDPGLPPGSTSHFCLVTFWLFGVELHHFSLPAELLGVSQGMISGGDGYGHPPPLSRLLSPQSGPGPAAVLQASHFQMSPLLHPLVGQHILTVRQFSKEQVESIAGITMLHICEWVYMLLCCYVF